MRRPRPAGAVGAAEFEQAMGSLGPWSGFPSAVVAVSGGPDSLALTLLADRWMRAKGGALLAVTVDHGLRPEAAKEARAVKAWLAARGIAHRTLRWRGDKPLSNIAATARAARYALLAGACRRAGTAGLLLGHQQEDQAETFLLRLGRGSGVDGLAAMAPRSSRDGIELLRPLLDVPRARLLATLQAFGQPWIEDPSNADMKAARVRVRALLPQLAEAGIAPGRIAAAAANLGRARQALEAATAALLAEAISEEAGGRTIDIARLAAAPREIGLRALDRVLRAVGGRELPPRLERLERLYDAIVAGNGGTRTFSGCLLRTRRGIVVVAAEKERRRP